MNKKPIIIYLMITFIFSWSLAAIFYLAGSRLSSPYAGPILILYMFGPLAGALVTQKFIYKNDVVKSLAISFKLNKWYLFAWLLPPLLAFAAMGINLLFNGISFSPEMVGMMDKYRAVLTPEQVLQMQTQLKNMPVHPVWLMLLQGLVAGATINALAAFGEELGWRGFLYKELSGQGFWRCSLIIGTIWGIWHAPIILQGHNYPQHPILGVLLMTIWCILLTPIFNLVRQKTHSVIGAALAHGTLNGTAGIAVVMIQGGNDLTTGLMGAPGFIILAVVNVAIYFYLKYSIIIQ